MATTPRPKSQENILNALLLHQAKQEGAKAKEQFEKTKQEHETLTKEHEGLKKKKELDDKLHKETRQELMKLKSQYDPKYAVEEKQVRKETMQRARSAKTVVKKAKAVRPKKTS